MSPVAAPIVPAIAGVSGGGLVSQPVAAPTGVPTTMATPEQLIPVLQSLIETVNALIAALGGGGAGAPVANATSGAGALGAPSAPIAGGGAHAGGHAGHAGGKPGGARSAPKGHHGMKIIPRTKPVDVALAQRNFDAVYGMLSKHTRAGLDFKNNQTHGYLSEAERNEFRRRNPGLPVPQSLVFREGSNTPIGVAYRTTDPNFDLGMGTRHDHTGDNAENQMMHIWFTPGDLEFAFSDVANGMTGSTAAAMKKRGFPT